MIFQPPFNSYFCIPFKYSICLYWLKYLGYLLNKLQNNIILIINVYLFVVDNEDDLHHWVKMKIFDGMKQLVIFLMVIYFINEIHDWYWRWDNRMINCGRCCNQKEPKCRIMSSVFYWYWYWKLDPKVDWTRFYFVNYWGFKDAPKTSENSDNKCRKKKVRRSNIHVYIKKHIKIKKISYISLFQWFSKYLIV